MSVYKDQGSKKLGSSNLLRDIVARYLGHENMRTIMHGSLVHVFHALSPKPKTLSRKTLNCGKPGTNGRHLSELQKAPAATMQPPTSLSI